MPTHHQAHTHKHLNIKTLYVPRTRCHPPPNKRYPTPFLASTPFLPSAMLRMNLLVYRDLWRWLDEPYTKPPDPPRAAIGIVRLKHLDSSDPN